MKLKLRKESLAAFMYAMLQYDVRLCSSVLIGKEYTQKQLSGGYCDVLVEAPSHKKDKFLEAVKDHAEEFEPPMISPMISKQAKTEPSYNYPAEQR